MVVELIFATWPLVVFHIRGVLPVWTCQTTLPRVRPGHAQGTLQARTWHAQSKQAACTGHSGHAQGILKACTRHSPGTHNTHTAYKQGLDHSCIGHAKGKLGAHTWPDRGTHSTRTGHAQGMNRACIRHARGMDGMCPIHALCHVHA